MTDIPYLDRLGDGLRDGIARRHRRVARRRRIALIGGPALAAALAALLLSTGPGDSRAALAIEIKGEWIELRLADPEASVERMNRELHDAGIDAVVRVVPVSRSLAGRWACVAEVADGHPEGRGPRGPRYRVRLGEVRRTRDTVFIRRDFAREPQDGRLLLVAGREARAGEEPSETPCLELRRLAPDLVPPVLGRG